MKQIPTERYCYNCGRLLRSVRLENHTARFYCSHCRVEIYSRIKTRRMEEVKVYLPVGEFIVDCGLDVSGF